MEQFSRAGIQPAVNLKLWGWLLAACLAASTGLGRDMAGTAISIADLRTQLARHGHVIASFSMEGWVCAIAPDRTLLALQDNSGTVLLKTPVLAEDIRPGDWVEVSGENCALTRGHFGIELATAPVVDNSGHHPAITKTGEVFLKAGWQSISATWFNGAGPAALKIEYEGPGNPRQVIPSTALFHRTSDQGLTADLKPGLDFEAYNGEDWANAEPDYSRLIPLARGVATNFDLRYAIRAENTALVFKGLLNVPASGFYTFWLTSDDGGYLYVGGPDQSCKVSVLTHKSAPTPLPVQEVIAAGRVDAWTEVEGVVTFISQKKGGVELEVASKGAPVQTEIFLGGQLLSSNLLHRKVRIIGVLGNLPDLEGGESAQLLVTGCDQIKVEPSDEMPRSRAGGGTLLTEVREIRNLTPAEAGRRAPVLIRGVVTWSSSRALVLQDHTGGVYIDYAAEDWTAQPAVGEFWKVEGETDPGQFSPVIHATRAEFLGEAPLPEPIHPTWSQLLNGSLDAEYVELRGALIGLSSSELVLLTSDGRILIHASADHPLPYLPELPNRRSYLDAIVRMRGCLTAEWDDQTRLVREGSILLSPGTVEVEESAPRDPFKMAAKRVADLLLFDPNASMLQRIKVSGQIVLASPGEYCLQDGAAGLRLRAKENLALEPGDMVEAVGFPQLGGPFPVLREARVHEIGKAAFPPPVSIAGTDLLDHSHDSTRVRMEAILVNDRMGPRERVLELQAGEAHFVARLKSIKTMGKLLPAGSRLLLTGVYLSAGNERAAGNLDAFELGLTNTREIRVLRRPPWWTVRRALAVIGLLAGVLVIALVWIRLLRRKVEERTAQLQKEIEERQLVEHRRTMERERTRVAEDLHDELGAGLTEVGLLGDLVKNPNVPPPEKQQYLGQLTDTARSLVASLDEIVWAVNPRYDSVADMASYSVLFAQRFLDLAGVACRPHLSPIFPEYPLDPKDRHGLFLAFKEALNNVVRHSGATEVHLKIEASGGELMMLLRDNGRGFDPLAAAPGGEGLHSMRHRLEQLGGICEIRSQVGIGAEIVLRLPIEHRKS